MSDMERGRLVGLHGASSQVVADYDQRAFARRNAEDMQRGWDDAFADPPGTPDTRTGGNGGAGGGEALGKLLAILLLLAAAYGAFLLAAEAARTLLLVWREALLGIGTAAHLALAGCLLLSAFAVWSGLRTIGRVRRLGKGSRIAVLLVAIPVGQVLLWGLGRLLLALPFAGPLLRAPQDMLAAHLPRIVASRGDIAADVAAAAVASLAVVFAIPAWQLVERTGVALTGRGLAASAWLSRKGLAGPGAVLGATALLLAIQAMPVPPLEMPFGIWVHGAIIVGLLFGWRVGLAAGLLAVAAAQPGFEQASAMFRDGSALRRIALWWSGFVVTAAAAGMLRPGLRGTPAGEVRAAFLATGLGLAGGCLAMVAIELAEIGPGDLGRLVLDYWFDFLPPYALGYAASIGIGAGIAAILRLLATRWGRRAAATSDAARPG